MAAAIDLGNNASDDIDIDITVVEEPDDLDKEIEAAFETATVDTNIEPDFAWLDQMANGMAFDVNPVVN